MIDSDLMLSAANLIQEAAEKLDCTSKTCNSCGHTHYGKWNEKQMFHELESMYRKLHKFASRKELDGTFNG